MKMSNLGELNKIYNFQDTIILCELFEQRSDLLKKYLNIIQKSATTQVHFLVVFIVTKARVVQRCLRTLILLGLLKKY